MVANFCTFSLPLWCCKVIRLSEAGEGQSCNIVHICLISGFFINFYPPTQKLIKTPVISMLLCWKCRIHPPTLLISGNFFKWNWWFRSAYFKKLLTKHNESTNFWISRLIDQEVCGLRQHAGIAPLAVPGLFYMKSQNQSCMKIFLKWREIFWT